MDLEHSNSTRTVLIGDVHGCLSELVQLIQKLYIDASTRLIFLGDLVDRGPDPLGVVRFVKWLQGSSGIETYCLLGNHEEKLVRWAKHERNRAINGKANPMKIDDAKRAEYDRFSLQDLNWMASLPTYLRFTTGEQRWIATHAGVPTDKPIEEQKFSELVRTRYVDKDTGAYASTGNAFDTPENSVRWYERWTGPEHVVYGHAIYSLSHPTISFNGDVDCYGLDTGCVFGGELTALVIPHDTEKPRIESVKAARAYKAVNNPHVLNGSD